MMLEKAIIPTAEILAPFVEEATSNQTKEQFITGFVKNAATILTSNPATYRAYGMFWWALKDLLNEHGYTQFGQDLELGTVSVFNYEDKALLCCAAYVYHAHNLDNGSVYSSSHLVAIEGEDDKDYYLEDLEMESLILG